MGQSIVDIEGQKGLGEEDRDGKWRDRRRRKKLETKPEDGMGWNRVDMWVKNDDRISPVVTPGLRVVLERD